MDALLRLAGIDPAQWRALTGTYLQMDLRQGGGARKKGRSETGRTMMVHAALLLGAGLNSLMIGLLVFLLDDPFTGALITVSMVAINVALLVLIDFSGSVISPVDYWVIAPRPVSSRTYFAARVTAVLAYVLAIAGVMSFLPAIVFLARHGFGIGGFIGTLAASMLLAATVTGVIIGAYTWILGFVAPGRMVRALSWAQLAGSSLSMAGFLFVIRAMDDPRIRGFSLAEAEWIWYVPATWSASIIMTLAGRGGPAEWSAAVGAVAMAVTVLPAAVGRLSLEFASRLAETTSASGAPGSTIGRLPGFRDNELYAVATLIRAQFRYDLRFRLAVLSILPMTLFYLLLGIDDGSLADPFRGMTQRPGTPVYLAVAFLPMVLHGAFQSSDQWRAAWIFFATPADAGRLVVATKNFVAVFFLGAYLLMMAVLWSFFYDSVWHAFVHAAFIGAGAHMLLQGAVILNPALPFAKEPRRGEQSARLFVLFFFGSIGAGIGPLLLIFVYQRPLWMLGLAFVLLIATMLLERLLHRRAGAFVGELEFG